MLKKDGGLQVMVPGASLSWASPPETVPLLQEEIKRTSVGRKGKLQDALHESGLLGEDETHRTPTGHCSGFSWQEAASQGSLEKQNR